MASFAASTGVQHAGYLDFRLQHSDLSYIKILHVGLSDTSCI